MSRRTTIAQRLHQRRQNREYLRALDNASPSLRQELIAAAAHQQSRMTH